MPTPKIDLSRLYEAILNGKTDVAVQMTQAALAERVDPQELVTRHMIPAMDEVGRRFESEQYFLPELLIAARAMKGALALVRPLLAQRGIEPAGRVVIGTVRGDLHDIGKSLVASMLEGGGFHVTDLGTDVAPERFVEESVRQNAHILGLSALLTTTMTGMRSVMGCLAAAGLRGKLKVIIGGAPVTQQYADTIGADGYSASASGAVQLARKLMAG